MEGHWNIPKSVTLARWPYTLCQQPVRCHCKRVYLYLEQLQRGRVGREGELGADDGGLVPAAEGGGRGGGGGGGTGLGGLDGGPRRLRVVAATVVDAVVEDEVVLRLEVQQVHRAPLAPAK